MCLNTTVSPEPPPCRLDARWSFKGTPVDTIQNFERGMGEGYNVQGAMVGRNVLYPGKDDPAAVASAVCDVVHSFATSLEAVRALRKRRGLEMSALEGLLS